MFAILSERKPTKSEGFSLKNKYWILLFVFLAALCLVVGLFLPQEGKPATHAQIRNAELDITVDLSEDQEFTVKASDGGFNTVTVRDGKIAVTAADCPDKYCIRQGFCNSGVQIVCLPHGLVISFINDSGIDGAVG